MGKSSRSKTTKKLAGKTVAFVGKIGYGSYVEALQVYTQEAGGKVVDVASAVPDYLVFDSSRGKLPSAVARVQRQHPTVQPLDVIDFLRLLLPSRDELYALLQSGSSEPYNEWDRFGEFTQVTGTVYDLTGVDLRKAHLNWAPLTSVNLSGADLRQARASCAKFGDLKSVQCDGADLTNASFFDAEDCSFRQATLTDALLSHEHPRKYVQCDFRGAKLDKVEGKGSQFLGCDFAEADLSDAQIEHSSFVGANLARANLTRAHFSRSNFQGANLEGAVLFRANFQEASLVNADLRHADLRMAFLCGADLTGAQVEGADFTGAVLAGAKITGLDASGAKNFQPTPARPVGPKVRELAQVAASSPSFSTWTNLKLGKGESARLNLDCWITNNQPCLSAYTEHQRGDEEIKTTLEASTFEEGMLNLAARWPGGTLLLDQTWARGSRSPRGKKLLQLVLAAWTEAYGLEESPIDQVVQKKFHRDKDLPQKMLEELRGGPAGVKKWNARDFAERARIRNLQGQDFTGLNLAGVELSGYELAECRFTGANLKKANLTSCNLKSVDFSGADLTGADLGPARCQEAIFDNAKMKGCLLFGADLTNARFGAADLRGAFLFSSYLQGADFTDAQLKGAELGGANYDAATKFPQGFVPPESMILQSPPPEIPAPEPAVTSASLDFATFFKQLPSRVASARLDKALAMLKAERFQLFSEVKDTALVGVVKSQSNPGLVYSCRLTSTGSFACCTQNLRPCGGLCGALCKHLLVLIVGLTRAEKLDPATADAWVLASQKQKPQLDKDVMSETFLRYKGAEAGEIDWRPTETIPEDYYAL